MKNKVIMRIALVLLLITMILCFANNIVYADNFDFSGFEGKTADNSIKKPVEDALGAALNVIRIVGTGISIIILATIAMKYMIASPGDRADFKKGAIQYVVGALVLFGAVNIMNILVKVIPTLVPKT